MNKYLDIAVRTTTLLVVSFPFFAWWYLAFSTPYTVREACAAADTECRIDKLDAHTTP